MTVCFVVVSHQLMQYALILNKVICYFLATQSTAIDEIDVVDTDGVSELTNRFNEFFFFRFSS